MASGSTTTPSEPRRRERHRAAAEIILDGFREYHDRFRAVTRHARRRFERGDWPEIQLATVDRLALYAEALRSTLDQLKSTVGDGLGERDEWVAVKAAFANAILGLDDFELAQSFFNSLTRRLHPHIGVDPALDFVAADFPLPWRGWEMAAARTYAVRQLTPEFALRLLEDADLRGPFGDVEAAARTVAGAARAGLDPAFEGTVDAIDVLRPVFVRNKAAYVVGRARRGDRVQPLILAIVHRHHRFEVDAVIQSPAEASIVFSFARWYFHADVETPRAVIGFLHSILPRKRIAELYISLGYDKHGKTELYQDLMTQVAETDERFIVAPGQPGLVMEVFTLPAYEFVIKVIKDCIPGHKSVSRSQVLARYRHVLHHDRVGRLVDYQEFEDLVLPRARFSADLLARLCGVAGRTVQVDGDGVIVRHAYLGRRVEPLDLFLRRADPQRARAAVADWGQAIKDLAAANIFAGDMLAKNFGVTRHGRVVFYDYDELRPLTECRFRRIPPALDPADELASQPWFSIQEQDVFPEELERFLGLPDPLREVFLRRHADLLEVGYWRGIQARVGEGELVDFFPYSRLAPPELEAGDG